MVVSGEVGLGDNSGSVDASIDESEATLTGETSHSSERQASAEAAENAGAFGLPVAMSAAVVEPVSGGDAPLEGKAASKVKTVPKTKVVPKTKAAPKVKARSKAKAAPKAKVRPKASSVPKAKVRPKAKTAPKGKVEPKTEAAQKEKATPKAKTGGPKPKSKPTSKSKAPSSTKNAEKFAASQKAAGIVNKGATLLAPSLAFARFTSSWVTVRTSDAGSWISSRTRKAADTPLARKIAGSRISQGAASQLTRVKATVRGSKSYSSVSEWAFVKKVSSRFGSDS